MKTSKNLLFSKVLLLTMAIMSSHCYLQAGEEYEPGAPSPFGSPLKKATLHVDIRPSKNNVVVFIKPPQGLGEEILISGIAGMYEEMGRGSVDDASLVYTGNLSFPVLKQHRSTKKNTAYRVNIFAPNRSIEENFKKQTIKLITEKFLTPNNPDYQQLLRDREAAYKKMNPPVIKFLLSINNNNQEDENPEVTVKYDDENDLSEAILKETGNVIKATKQ